MYIENACRAEESSETPCKNIQAFAILNTEQFFLHFLSLYACLYVCIQYMLQLCIFIMYLQGVGLISGLRGL